MTIGQAGKIDIQVYRGALFTQRLEFFVGDTNEIIDMSGQGPWLCEVRDGNDELILTIEVADFDTDPTLPLNALVLTASETATEDLLIPATHRWGLQNAQSIYVLEGAALINKKIPV